MRGDLSRFGLIDQVKIVGDKNICFVRFLSISVATNVRSIVLITLYSHSAHASAIVACQHAPSLSSWAGKHVTDYGEDRCARVPESQQVFRLGYPSSPIFLTPCRSSSPSLSTNKIPTISVSPPYAVSLLFLVRIVAPKPPTLV